MRYRISHLVCFCLIVLNVPVYGQGNVQMSRFKDSYIISWPKQEGVKQYDYIVTDNSLCFRGCAGDTKEGIVNDTSLLVAPNYPGRNYFWRISPVKSETDTNRYWSEIKVFNTLSSSDSKPTDWITISPNPSSSNLLKLTLDWLVVQNEATYDCLIYDSKGNVVSRYENFSPKNRDDLRFSSHDFDLHGLKTGHYFLLLSSKKDQTKRHSLRFSIE